MFNLKPLFNPDRQNKNNGEYILQIQADPPSSFEELEDYSVKLSNAIASRFGKKVTRECHTHIIIDSDDFTHIMNIRNEYKHIPGIDHVLSLVKKHFQQQSERIGFGGSIRLSISGDELHNSIDLEPGDVLIATHDQLYIPQKGDQICAEIQVCVGQDSKNESFYPNQRLFTAGVDPWDNICFESIDGIEIPTLKFAMKNGFPCLLATIEERGHQAPDGYQPLYLGENVYYALDGAEVEQGLSIYEMNCLDEMDELLSYKVSPVSQTVKKSPKYSATILSSELGIENPANTPALRMSHVALPRPVKKSPDYNYDIESARICAKLEDEDSQFTIHPLEHIEFRQSHESGLINRMVHIFNDHHAMEEGNLVNASTGETVTSIQANCVPKNIFPWLISLPNNKRKITALKEDQPILIGRHPLCGICLDEPQYKSFSPIGTSGFHALILKYDFKWSVLNLSGNFMVYTLKDGEIESRGQNKCKGLNALLSRNNLSESMPTDINTHVAGCSTCKKALLPLKDGMQLFVGLGVFSFSAGFER